VIEVAGLTKRYGSKLAVDSLDFRVPRGTITGFLGPNGAGKTTTLRCLLGLVQPTAGAATIDGRDYRELGEPSKRVGAVLEASNVHPGRSGRNHLRVLAAAASIPESRVDEVIALVELTPVARKRAKTYSLGMRQRLGLAAALLGEPEVLILDEPANGLDPQGIRWLRGFLRSMSAGGMTVLVSSHVLSEVEQTVDEVVIIHRGRFVAHATTAELAARVAGNVRARSPEVGRLRDVLASAGIAVTPLEPDGLTADSSPERIGELAAANGIVLHELVAEAGSLEDAFLELTGGETVT
jgi:ABC-2 type transport system ATP-binding protein